MGTDTSLSESEEFKDFKRAASQGNLVPMYERLFSDQLTPVLAYRCLVEHEDRESPSFLFESVQNGDQQVTHACYLCHGISYFQIWKVLYLSFQMKSSQINL